MLVFYSSSLNHIQAFQLPKPSLIARRLLHDVGGSAVGLCTFKSVGHPRVAANPTIITVRHNNRRKGMMPSMMALQPVPAETLMIPPPEKVSFTSYFLQ